MQYIIPGKQPNQYTNCDEIKKRALNTQEPAPFKVRFSRFFFTFWQVSLNTPKTMSLLPSSPKIITSAPQLPENKTPFSPAPPKPMGPYILKIVMLHIKLMGMKHRHHASKFPAFLHTLDLLGLIIFACESGKSKGNKCRKTCKQKCFDLMHTLTFLVG